MALPKISHPTFTLELPSNKTKIRYRPFTVKEEKIILIAQNTDSFDAKIDAIKQLINNCILDKEFDVDNITMFDLEFIFINLRAKSVNNILTLNVEDEDDGKKYSVEVDLNNIEVIYPDKETNKIQLSDEVGVLMKYPAYKVTKDIEKLVELADKIEDYMDASLKIFASCIDKVYDNETVLIADVDFTNDEAVEFISNISSSAYEKFEEFFKAAPTVVAKGNYKNSNGVVKEIKIENISDFFT
jgi:hypothetical protein